MTNRGTTRTDLDAAAEAAAFVLANELGLGDETRVTDDWPIDDGDAVLVVTLSGDMSGSVVLAVNDDVADRLLGNAAVLGAAFDAARDRITAALGCVLEGAPATRSSADRPLVAVEILDGGQLTALAGLTLPIADPAAAIAHDFEPVAFDPTPEFVGVAPQSTLSVLNDVDLVVTAELGRTTMPVRELLGLTPGMVVEIDRTAGSPIDLLVNGRRIAAGEVVVIDEEFGIRITEIAVLGRATAMTDVGLGELIVRMVVSLGIVLAIVLGAYALLRRRPHFGSGGGGGSSRSTSRSSGSSKASNRSASGKRGLRIVGRIGVSRTSSVMAVQFAERVFLVGASDHASPAVLAELSLDEWESALEVPEDIIPLATTSRSATDPRRGPRSSIRCGK